MTQYPDPRYPELRCEDPTAPGCATLADYLRWIEHALTPPNTQSAIIGSIVLGTLLYAMFLILRNDQRQLKEDDGE